MIVHNTATGIQYSSLSAGIANAVGTHQRKNRSMMKPFLFELLGSSHKFRKSLAPEIAEAVPVTCPDISGSSAI